MFPEFSVIVIQTSCLGGGNDEHSSFTDLTESPSHLTRTSDAIY